MICRNFDELCHAAYDADPLDTDATKRVAELIKVYFDALHCPPPGVIGVGAISYAERVLIAAQNKA